MVIINFTVMRLFICLLFILFTVNSFSQTKEIKVSKKSIEDSKAINDFIKELKDCKVFKFLFSCNFSSTNYKEYTIMGDAIPFEVKAMLAKLEKGKTFYIEKISSNCAKPHKEYYKIILD